MSGQRASPSPLAGDIERDDWLTQNEFRVVRFWNNDVLQNLEGVLTNLAAELNTTPHPSSRLRSTAPSPARGEGKKEIARSRPLPKLAGAR
jgi:hypothetical protein